MRLFGGLGSFALKNYFVLCAVTLIFLYTGDIALAQDAAGANAIAATLCAAIKLVQGPPGKAISIIVIISVALGMFFGKVSWALGIMVCIAMGILFGADKVVQLITSSSTPICS